MSKETKAATDKVKLPLSKPIKAHGEEISVLEISPMTGTDLLEIGEPPFQLDDKKRMHMDMALTGEYLVRLAGIPPSAVRDMAPMDLISAFAVIAGFFGDLGTTLKRSSKGTGS